MVEKKDDKKGKDEKPKHSNSGFFIFVIIALFLIFYFTNDTSWFKEKTGQGNTDINPKGSAINMGTGRIMMSNGLIIEDLIVGNGEEVRDGDELYVNYAGILENGKAFDSNLDKNKPFVFNIGEGKVIRGWEEGIIGMRIGGTRKLTIPPNLGYGSRAVGSIPANSTLIFEVELLDIR